MSVPQDPTWAAGAPAVPRPGIPDSGAGWEPDQDRTVLRPAAPTVPGGAVPAGSEIATLPAPPPPTVAGLAISTRTGEPRRPVLLGVACGLLYAGAAIGPAGMLKVLWDSTTVARFPTAARVLTWVPGLDPVSFVAILMVLLVALLGAAVATAAATVAYNAWNGASWAPVAGLVAVGVSLLTILLNPLAMAAIAPIAAGAGLLWLPQVSAYFAAWRQVRRPAAPPSPATNVHYGPLPRYV